VKTQVNIRQFSDLIRILAKNISLFDKFNASCCGLSIGQCYAIVEIGLAKEISLNDLASLLNLDNSTMSRTINNLVEQGLVHREVAQTDRRYLKIKLTEKGNQFYQNTEEKINLYYEKILQSIPADKRTQVVESLSLLSDALKANKCC